MGKDPKQPFQLSCNRLLRVGFQGSKVTSNGGLIPGLDLGTVGNVAEVTLNGKRVGVAWMQPYWLNVTEALQSGPNRLEVLVTNTLINYVSGMKELPKVPAELVPHYTAPRLTLTIWEWQNATVAKKTFVHSRPRD